MKAVRLMVREEIHRVIVLDDHGEMVPRRGTTNRVRADVVVVDCAADARGP